MRILLLGDIVGKPGRRILGNQLRRFIRARSIDFVVANAENSSGGSGITEAIVKKLRKYGCDILTNGDHVVKKAENRLALEKFSWCIRPGNYGEDLPGRGVVMVEKDGVRIAVINVIGNVFLADKLPSPFSTVDDLISEVKPHADIIIVDLHAEATSEKIAMGWHLDGRVSAVFGTHTHIQTADERILPQGTAYITDVGMVGPYESVIGRDTKAVLKWFVQREHVAFHVADGDVQMRGAIVDVDPVTGKATHIERVAEREVLLPGLHPNDVEADAEPEPELQPGQVPHDA